MKIEPLRIYEEPPAGRVQWSRDEAGRWWRRQIGSNARNSKGWAPSSEGPARWDLRLASPKKTRLPKIVDPEC